LHADRKILLAAAVAGVSTVGILITQVVSKVQPSASGAELAFWLTLAGAILVLSAVLLAAPLALQELEVREQLAVRTEQARRQMQLLFEMTDALQSAVDFSNAKQILQRIATELLPDFAGSLYILNSSRDRLDLSACWNSKVDLTPSEYVYPDECWALHRGRAHVSRNEPHALRCFHHQDSEACLDLPMTARGEVFGLLKFSHQVMRLSKN
jgi:hypothetical protein